MAEEEGRPDFDLSSFSTFTLSGSGHADALPDETSEIVEDGSGELQMQQQDFLSPKAEPRMASQDGKLADLKKYGPPAALAKLNKTVPVTVLAVIENSIDNVRAQVDTETELRHRQEQMRRQNTQAELSHQVRKESLGSTGKGKRLETPQIKSVSDPASSAASEQTETASFYTPSEGCQSPSADAQSEIGTDVPIAGDNVPHFTPMPRLKASSTSAIPRRRDLIKAMFRGMSDIDARRHVLRRSTVALQFKAKLKHAKQIWQGEVQIGFVSPTRAFVCLVPRILIILS